MAQIKKDTSLRKAILQAAITGQLISSCHSELDSESAETGKELLDKIIEERNNKLLAEWEEKQTDLFASNDAHSKNAKTVRSEQIRLLKKAKKPALVVASEIDEEEIPFEIPENWCWCKLEDLVTILGDGLHGTPQYDISGEYYFVNGNNLNNGLIEINPDTKKVNKKEYDKYKKELNETTIFVSINGTIGNIAFYNYEKIILGKSACYFNVAIEDLKKYFFYLFQTDFFLNYALDNATGTTIKNVGLGTMRNFLLPLPPLSVQNAIVAKLEQALPLVDAYENAVLQKEELKSTLPDKVKKAILQEAITGKLTENWRKSATIKESGKQLLDRIIEERNAKALADWEEALKKNVGGKATLPSFASKTRAKKPVPVVASEIEEEEIPFEVPESWCWCRIDDLFAHNSGKALNKSENKVGTELEYITTSNLYWNYFELDNLKTMLFKDEEIEKCTVKKGDLLVCEGGEVGRSAIWNYDRTVCIQNHIHRLRAYDSKLNVLFYYHVMYLFKESKVIDNYAKGIGIKGLSSNALGSIIVPLPPLEEQEEIVKKVEELLPLCK